MRLAELTAFHVRIALRKKVKHASYTRTENDTLIVRCRLDDGTEGWGEGLPRPYVTGETIDTALAHLRSQTLRQQLSGPLDSLGDAVALLDGFRFDDRPDGVRDCFGNAARCAVEISLLDAVGRATGEPLSRVTELVPETEPIRDRADRVQYSPVFTASRPAKEILRALLFRGFGFRQAKVKVGVAGADDAASLRRIRRVLGAKFDLRLDANEAWTCSELEAKLAPLLPFGISSVEQPVPHEQVAGLAEVRRRLPVKFMLDESLCSLGDAERAIAGQTCDYFNIRLSKCGGFVPSLRLAVLARQAGLGCQLGCQVGETGILSAAGRHFATSVRELRFLEGSYDRFLVRERLTAEDVTFGRGGWAPALDGPGLGVTVDPQRLGRVLVHEEHIPFG